MARRSQLLARRKQFFQLTGRIEFKGELIQTILYK